MNNETKHLLLHLKAATFWIVFFVFVLYWISEKPGDRKYVNELEKVVAKCLEGGAVTVGNQVHLCSTYDTGERI